jgi:sugar phosphate permease
MSNFNKYYNNNKMNILTNIAIKLAVFYVTAPNLEVAQKLS